MPVALASFGRLLAPASPCGSGWALGDRPLTRLAYASPAFPRARLSRARTGGWPPGQPPNRDRGRDRRAPNTRTLASAHNSQVRELNLFRLYIATPNVVRRISDLSTSAHAIWDTPHVRIATR